MLASGGRRMPEPMHVLAAAVGGASAMYCLMHTPMFKSWRRRNTKEAAVASNPVCRELRPCPVIDVLGVDLACAIMRYNDRSGILASRTVSPQWMETCSSGAVMRGNTTFAYLGQERYSIYKAIAQSKIFGEAIHTLEFSPGAEAMEPRGIFDDAHNNMLSPNADDLACILSRCPFVTRLSFRAWATLYDEDVAAVAEATAGRLEALVLFCSSYVPASPAPLLDLLRGCARLRSLSLGFERYGRAFPSISSILIACPRLAELHVSNLWGNDEEGHVLAPIASAPHASLASLRLSSAFDKLTEAHLEQLAHLAATLTHLDLAYSLYGVAPRSVRALVARLPKLTCLEFQGIDEDVMGDDDERWWWESEDEHWLEAQAAIKARLPRNAQIDSHGGVSYLGPGRAPPSLAPGVFVLLPADEDPDEEFA
jgi:hypothetical protein